MLVAQCFKVLEEATMIDNSNGRRIFRSDGHRIIKKKPSNLSRDKKPEEETCTENQPKVN